MRTVMEIIVAGFLVVGCLFVVDRMNLFNHDSPTVDQAVIELTRNAKEASTAVVEALEKVAKDGPEESSVPAPEDNRLPAEATPETPPPAPAGNEHSSQKAASASRPADDDDARLTQEILKRDERPSTKNKATSTTLGEGQLQKILDRYQRASRASEHLETRR